MLTVPPQPSTVLPVLGLTLLLQPYVTCASVLLGWQRLCDVCWSRAGSTPPSRMPEKLSLSPALERNEINPFPLLAKLSWAFPFRVPGFFFPRLQKGKQKLNKCSFKLCFEEKYKLVLDTLGGLLGHPFSIRAERWSSVAS